LVFGGKTWRGFLFLQTIQQAYLRRNENGLVFCNSENSRVSDRKLYQVDILGRVCGQEQKISYYFLKNLEKRKKYNGKTGVHLDFKQYQYLTIPILYYFAV